MKIDYLLITATIGVVAPLIYLFGIWTERRRFAKKRTRMQFSIAKPIFFDPVISRPTPLEVKQSPGDVTGNDPVDLERVKSDVLNICKVSIALPREEINRKLKRHSNGSISKALDHLVNCGRLVRTGKGVRGNPYGYRIAQRF